MWRSNYSTVMQPKSAGGNTSGTLKTQSGEKRRRGGGADLLAEEEVRPGEAQISILQNKRMGGLWAERGGGLTQEG